MKLQKPRYVYSDTFLVQKPRDAIHNQHAIFLRILPGRIVDGENIARSGAGASGAVVLILGRQTRVKSCSNNVMPLKMNEVHHAPISIPFIVSDSNLVPKYVTYEVENTEPRRNYFAC